MMHELQNLVAVCVHLALAVALGVQMAMYSTSFLDERGRFHCPGCAPDLAGAILPTPILATALIRAPR
jgi:hypothetical protein